MATPIVNSPPDGGLPPAPARSVTDPEVTRLRQELDQQRQTTKNIMDRLAAASPPVATPVVPGQPNKKDLEKQFFSAPLESTAQIARDVAEAVAKRGMDEMSGQFETLKAVARDKVRAGDAEIFDKYVMEIEAKVYSLPQNFHTNIQVWQNAFNLVKGEHLSEIRSSVAPPAPNAPSVHVSTDGGPAAPSRNALAPSKEKLTDEEHQWAHNFGLSDDEYRAGKEHIANQNARGPSSWDAYITTDSRQKRKEERKNANRRAAA